MVDSPASAMLFTALLSVGFIGYMIFRIARGFYRWAMGRPTAGTYLGEDEIDLDTIDKETHPSYRLLPGNIFHEDVYKD